MVELLHGDCLERLQELPDCSVDACVTDPPYGLRFMGKAWDYDVPQAEVWREVLRVLKPGGHLLAFAGTRTQHRMAVQIEDAGFEIRDMIAWLYGSGFPKSLDVSKAIDKAAGAEREVVGVTHRTRGICGEMAAAVRCSVCGKTRNGTSCKCDPDNGPATPEAQRWDGWGTALKPALEPITVARKPLQSTVAANVLEHGTGAINIEGCRVGTTKDVPASLRKGRNSGSMAGYLDNDSWDNLGMRTDIGRWPANLIHDGSDEVTELFPQNVRGAIPGTQKIGDKTTTNRDNNVSYATCGYQKISGYKEEVGSAARFFYCAKASKADREDGNGHPTVKPTDLMRYLCRLVTPPGGIVLDPFMGSGSTGKAAVLEGFRFIGIEREAEYIEIARGRIQVPEQVQEDLF
jgi:DNA modification methylase